MTISEKAAQAFVREIVSRVVAPMPGRGIARVSYNVELSRGDMALIINALSWVMFTPAFQGMTHQYKIKHRKLFKEFEKVLDKK